MTRKFKGLGLGLLAVLAIGAVMAPAASATEFTADSYPVNLAGSQPGGTPHVFTVTGGAVECEVASFTGVTGNGPSTTQTITPNYGGAGACEAFGFLGATVSLNGCDYLFHINAVGNGGNVDLVCPSGKEVTIADELNLCVVHIKGQGGLNGITYANNNPHIDVSAKTTNIHAVVTKNSIFCPIAGGTHNTATYTGTVTLKGAGGATKIDIG